MRKKKKVKTIIVEKFKYDDDDLDIRIEPSLLLKLLEFAREEATSDEQLHSIVSKAHMLSHDEDCLDMDDYFKLVASPITINAVDKESTPVESTATMPL